MDDGDAGPQSLFVAVSWDSGSPYYSSIIQLETPQVHNHENASSLAETKMEFSAHIPCLPWVQRPVEWEISLPPESSTGDLFMLPSCDLGESEIEKVGKLPGFIFNLSTKKCKIMKASLAPKFMGHVVTMGHHVYFMAQPWMNSPDPCFERYDTLSQSWEAREPLPADLGSIQATAVLDDTILFIIEGRKMWAYNVGRDKWYPVTVSNYLCYNIEGVPVVLNKIIYAMAERSKSLVAMTLKSQEIGGDVVFTCNLHKEYEYAVPGIEQDHFEYDSYGKTRHLVHLGKDNFCVVQSCNLYGVRKIQYIQVTYIEVSDKKSIVTNRCLHELKLPHGEQFIITHCFSMRCKCKTTTALKEGDRFIKLNPEDEAEIVTLPPELDEAEIVTLPPELLQFHDKYSLQLQTNIIDEQGGSVSQTSHSRDDADTTSQVQEDVPKKSSAASVVAGNSNVPSKASTVSEHQSLNYVTKASTLGDGAGKSNVPSKENIVPGPQSLNYATKTSALGDGHFICVTNLPLDTNSRQLIKRLKRFGRIKSGGIHTYFNNMMRECCYADVEFENATSKQNAIKESTITIGGRIAVIEEKRRTGKHLR